MRTFRTPSGVNNRSSNRWAVVDFISIVRNSNSDQSEGNSGLSSLSDQRASVVPPSIVTRWGSANAVAAKNATETKAVTVFIVCPPFFRCVHTVRYLGTRESRFQLPQTSLADRLTIAMPDRIPSWRGLHKNCG